MNSNDHVYQFGQFSVNARERVLFRNGQRVALTPKAIHTLIVLIQRRGRLVEKEVLMNEVWPNEPVEEGNLNQHIFKLRKALDETISNPRYIETIPRRGYRFVGSVRTVTDHESSTNSSQLTKAPPGVEHTPTIVVLPFVNLTGDSNNDYLSDGITEKVIKDLSHEPRLRVIARNIAFRYKGKESDAQRVGRELGVRGVLVGSIGLENRGFEIKVELIDSMRGWQLFDTAFHFASENLVNVTRDLAKKIVAGLNLRFDSQEQITNAPTKNSEALDAYMRGRYEYNKYTEAGLLHAIEHFRQAVTIDPSYAIAYEGMADSYFRLCTNYSSPLETLPKCEAALNEALRINPISAEAHGLSGLLKLRFKWDTQGAERELKQALVLDPTSSNIRRRYGLYLTSQRKFEDALDQFKISLEFEPLSLQSLICWGVCLWQMRRYGEAVVKLREVISMDPSSYPAHISLPVVLAQSGKFSEAFAEIKLALAIDDSVMVKGFFAHIYAVADRRSEARKILNEVTIRRKTKYVPAYVIALIHTGLDEYDLAFQWLETAYTDRDELLTWLGTDPRLDNLHADKRYVDLIKRVGLDPHYARPS